MNKFLIFIFLFCYVAFQSFAQISEGGIPYSKQALVSGSNYRVGSNMPAKTLPALDMVATNRELDSLNSVCKDCRLGYYGLNRTYITDIIAEGTKDSIPSVGNVWRYQITSAQATALQIHFSTFRVPPGAKMFLYSPDYAYTLGSFTKNNCNQSYTFNTQPIPGQTVILEYIEPFNPPYKGVIQTDYVTHNFIDIYDRSDGQGSINGEIGRSDPCEVDVACALGSGWQNEAKSVGLLLNNDFANQYSTFCSSVLMNNAFQDGFPYLLTANHCAPSPTVNDFIVIFDFQTTGCGNNQLARPYLTNSISGSHTVIAKGDRFTSSDYTLLQLSNFIPTSYGVCYAGWDMDATTGGYNSPYLVGIHHPNGDVKKISKSDRYLSVSDGLDNNGNPILDHQGVPYMTSQQIQKNWEIMWTTGVTEIGSSGSPLFNANHQVIGQFRGGFSECGVNKKDFYGKLSEAWNNGTYSTGVGNALGKGQIALKSMNTYCPATTPPNSSTNSVKVTDIYFKNGSGSAKYENCQGSVQFDREWIGNFTNNYDVLWTILSPASVNFILDNNAVGKTCPWITAGIIFPANHPTDYVDVVVQVRMTRNDNGNSSTMTKTLRLLRTTPAPTVSFPGSTANPTTAILCSGSNITLTANTTGALPTYNWNKLGAGTINGATNSTYTVTSEGTYYVYVKPATCNNRSSANIVVTINKAPTTATVIASGPTTFCSGGNVILTADTDVGFTYQWYNTGTLISAATSLSYSATTNGNYTVVVGSVGNCGPAVTSIPILVTVNATPSASIKKAGNVTTFCTDIGLVLQANTGTGLTYQWYQKDVLINNVPTTNPNYTTTIGGKHVVKVIANYVNGYTCSKMSESLTLFANAIPSVAAIIAPAGPVTICQGGNVLLSTATVEGSNLSYQWKNNNVAISGATNSSFFATVADSYTVQVSSTASPSCGASVTSMPTVATLTSPPQAIITPLGSTAICPGTSVVLNANTNNVATYKWSNTAGIIAGATNASYTATALDNYSVAILYNTGCSSTSLPVTVSINPLPTVNMVADIPTVLCNGSSAVLNTNVTGTGLNYQWTNNGVFTNVTTPSFIASAAGIYKAIVSNKCGNASAEALVIAPDNGQLSIGGINTSYNAGQYNSILYASCGIQFTSQVISRYFRRPNFFKVQLSDANGSFTSPVVIGGALGNQTKGGANIHIPNTTPAGQHYRIRVVSTSPAVISADNGFDINIIRTEGSVLISNNYQSVVIPNKTNYDFSGDFSFEATIKSIRTTFGVYVPIISAGSISFGILNYSSSPPSTLVLSTNGTNAGIIQSVEFSQFQANRCYHIAVTRTNGMVTFYLDGIAIGIPQASKPISNSSLPMYIGSDASTGANYNYFGKIDDVRLWNVALSPQTIYNNISSIIPGNSSNLMGYWDFNEASEVTAYDQSNTANHGTLSSLSTTVTQLPTRAEELACVPSGSTPSSVSSGLLFNGAKDGTRSTIPPHPSYNMGAGDFTIEAWTWNPTIYNSTSTTILASNRMSTYDPSFNKYISGFLLSVTSNTLMLQIGGYNCVGPNIGNIQNGSCHHIAATRLNNTIQFYFDGVAVGSAINCAKSINSSAPLYLGYDAIDSVSTNGGVNEFRIWNTVRSVAQISSNMRTDLAANTPNLIGYWKLNETSGETIFDASSTVNNGFLGNDVSVFDAKNPLRYNRPCYSTDRIASVDFDEPLEVDSSVNSVRIYPNPFTSEAIILISGNDFDQADIMITNVQGVTLYSGQITPNKPYAIGQQLSNGIYFVQVIGTDKKPQVFKIIKNQ